MEREGTKADGAMIYADDRTDGLTDRKRSNGPSSVFGPDKAEIECASSDEH